MLKLQVVSTLDKKTMKELAKKYGKGACEEMVDRIYEESQRDCPVKTGKLKESGYKRETKRGWDVGYDADYAMFVDRMPQRYFDRTGSGGKAHFFTGPLMKYKYGKGADGSDL